MTAGRQKVGVVKDMTLGEDDGLPHVTMRINGDFRLHQGAFADIRLTSNVGALNRVVDLRRATRRPPDSPTATCWGRATPTSPVDLDIATSTLDPKTRRDAAALLAGLDKATRGRGNDIAAILHHSSSALDETANVLQQVGYDGAALRSLVHDTHTIVAALAADPEALGATADRTATLLRSPATAPRSCAAPRMRSARRSPPGTRRSTTSPRQCPTCAGFSPLAPAGRGAGPVADSLPATIKPLRPTLREARQLVQRRRATRAGSSRLPPPRRHCFTSLEPTVRLFNPLLDWLRVRAPEGLGFFALAGDAIASYDQNGHLIRFIPRFIQVKANTDSARRLGYRARLPRSPLLPHAGRARKRGLGRLRVDLHRRRPWGLPVNTAMAKLSAATSVVLIAADRPDAWVTSHPGPGVTTVNAEFEDAFPILAGMNVRVSGAIAGSVREVELTDEGRRWSPSASTPVRPRPRRTPRPQSASRT